MSKEDVIEVEGTVVEALPNAMNWKMVISYWLMCQVKCV